MVGVEIDLIVKDSLAALELYEQIFEVERVEVTNFPGDKMKLCSPSMGCAFTCWTRTPSFSCRRQGRGH